MFTRSLIAGAFGIGLPAASASDFTFFQNGDWYTSGDVNWTPNPNGPTNLAASFFNTAGNNAIVNAAANYNAAGDFLLGAGNTMTVDGSSASWTQAVGVNNWVKVGSNGGNSTVILRNGGTFNVLNTSTQLRVGLDGGTGTFNIESTAGGLNLAGTTSLGIGSGSSVSIAGGTNTLSSISNGGSVSISGGTNTTGQFNGAGAYTVTGGTTTAASYDMTSATTALSVSAGSIGFTNLTNVKANLTGGSTSVSGTLNTNAASSFVMSGGTFTKSGSGNINLNASSTFQLSGSSQFNMTGSGEFQPGATGGTQSITGSAAMTIAGITAFQGGATQKFDVLGGTISIGGTAYDGIYSAGGYFNFTNASTGSILFTNAGAGQNNIFEGQIRYLDTIYSSFALADAVFDISHPTVNSTLIKLDAVPEPSSVVLTGLGVMGMLGIRRRRD